MRRIDHFRLMDGISPLRKPVNHVCDLFAVVKVAQPRYVFNDKAGRQKPLDQFYVIEKQASDGFVLKANPLIFVP